MRRSVLVSLQQTTDLHLCSSYAMTLRRFLAVSCCCAAPVLRCLWSSDLQHQELLVTRFSVPQHLLSISYLSIMLCIGCSAASVYDQLPRSLLMAARAIALLVAVAWLFAQQVYSIQGLAALLQVGWVSLSSALALGSAAYVRRELGSLQHSTQELQSLRYSCKSA
jgi:hypothetical protein